ncbi:unnamed protein product [Ectocarpus sp. 12 AP-2014]
MSALSPAAFISLKSHRVSAQSPALAQALITELNLAFRWQRGCWCGDRGHLRTKRKVKKQVCRETHTHRELKGQTAEPTKPVRSTGRISCAEYRLGCIFRRALVELCENGKPDSNAYRSAGITQTKLLLHLGRS